VESRTGGSWCRRKIKLTVASHSQAESDHHRSQPQRTGLPSARVSALPKSEVWSRSWRWKSKQDANSRIQRSVPSPKFSTLSPSCFGHKIHPTRWGLQKTNITSTSGPSRSQNRSVNNQTTKSTTSSCQAKESIALLDLSKQFGCHKIFTMILSAAARTLLRSPVLTTAARRLACRATLASHAASLGVRNFATVGLLIVENDLCLLGRCILNVTLVCLAALDPTALWVACPIHLGGGRNRQGRSGCLQNLAYR
jgi:hypothetical protein